LLSMIQADGARGHHTRLVRRLVDAWLGTPWPGCHHFRGLPKFNGRARRDGVYSARDKFMNGPPNPTQSGERTSNDDPHGPGSWTRWRPAAMASTDAAVPRRPAGGAAASRDGYQPAGEPASRLLAWQAARPVAGCDNCPQPRRTLTPLPAAPSSRSTLFSPPAWVQPRRFLAGSAKVPTCQRPGSPSPQVPATPSAPAPGRPQVSAGRPAADPAARAAALPSHPIAAQPRPSRPPQTPQPGPSTSGGRPQLTACSPRSRTSTGAARGGRFDRNGELRAHQHGQGQARLALSQRDVNGDGVLRARAAGIDQAIGRGRGGNGSSRRASLCPAAVEQAFANDRDGYLSGDRYADLKPSAYKSADGRDIVTMKTCTRACSRPALRSCPPGGNARERAPPSPCPAAPAPLPPPPPPVAPPPARAPCRCRPHARSDAPAVRERQADPPRATFDQEVFNSPVPVLVDTPMVRPVPTRPHDRPRAANAQASRS
jgi:hypothetical protein